MFSDGIERVLRNVQAQSNLFKDFISIEFS